MTEHGTGLDKTAAAALLDYLNRPDYRPVAQRELLHRTHVSSEDRPAVRRLIRRLIEEGRIIKTRGGKLAPALTGDAVRGVLQRHRDGFGFVIPDAGGEDLFIPPRGIGQALSGDRVLARITTRDAGGRLSGVIVDVVEPRSREVLGLFAVRGRGGIVQPFDPAFGETIRVPASFRMGAKGFEVVRVMILKPGEFGGAADGKVIEVLGRLDHPGTDALVVSRMYGLATEFPDDVLDEVRALPQEIGPELSTGRERFDAPEPVTIDGETAKDFDDAIAVEELGGGGFRLFVHIADVSRFVETGSVLDLEARRRGTSVYFPGTVLPMFPEELSNGLCSLRPGEDRLVQSAIIDFAPDGKRRSVRFADGVIRSAARLTYTQVAALLDDGTVVRGLPRAQAPMLQAAGRLARILEQRRRLRGSIDFDLPEPQILLDVEGAMTGVTIEPRNTAHKLIEEFMLAANEAVAAYLTSKKSACMFRIHEPPDPAKLETLQRFVEGFGLRLNVKEGAVSPAAIRALLERLEDRPEQRVVSQVALRCMKQARYTGRNEGHFGLASTTYCHFTSPIRRYPDLVVHRQLRASRQGRTTGDTLVGDALESLGESCSELERNAEAAERELLDWKKIAFVEGKVGEIFEGVVTGVARFGLFVQLVENLVEGLIRAEWLGDEPFHFAERRFELLGVRSGKAFRLGDRIRVRIDRVDRALRRVDLSPVGQGAKAKGQAPAEDRGPDRTRRKPRTRKTDGGRKSGRGGARRR